MRSDASKAQGLWGFEMQQYEKSPNCYHHRCARSIACMLLLVHAEIATAMADLVTARIVIEPHTF